MCIDGSASDCITTLTLGRVWAFFELCGLAGERRSCRVISVFAGGILPQEMGGFGHRGRFLDTSQDLIFHLCGISYHMRTGDVVWGRQ